MSQGCSCNRPSPNQPSAPLLAIFCTLQPIPMSSPCPAVQSLCPRHTQAQAHPSALLCSSPVSQPILATLGTKPCIEKSLLPGATISSLVTAWGKP